MSWISFMAGAVSTLIVSVLAIAALAAWAFVRARAVEDDDWF